MCHPGTILHYSNNCISDTSLKNQSILGSGVLKSLFSGKFGGCSQFLFNAHQLVEFFNALAAATAAGLDKTRIQPNSQVGNKGISCFTTAVRYKGMVAIFVRQVYCFQSLGNSSNLIQFDKD
jgi:hypothetical protein